MVIDGDELDRILETTDLDALERSAEQTQPSQMQSPAKQTQSSPAVASPGARKRPLNTKTTPVKEADDDADFDGDDGEDGGDDDSDEEVGTEAPVARSGFAPSAAPRKAFASAPTEPSSIVSREEKRQAKLRKFANDNQQRYAWLDEPRDEAGRPRGDPNYDPSTLYIPAPAQRAFTPFEQQYWDIKKRHFDTVVFFRKGKVRSSCTEVSIARSQIANSLQFFELFELDAEVGRRELGLRLSERHHMKMVGLPTTAFEIWAGKLIAKGYKVTKVEQVCNLISCTVSPAS